MLNLEKNFLRQASLFNWYETLISRFKKRFHWILQRFQTERYIMTEIKNKVNSRLYAQNIFRHVKTVEINSIFNQFIITWSNLHWKFRRDIFVSTPNTTIRKFFNFLNNVKDVWFDITAVDSKNISRFSKQDRRNRPNKNFQPFSEFNVFFFQRFWFIEYFVPFQNNAY